MRANCVYGATNCGESLYHDRPKRVVVIVGRHDDFTTALNHEAAAPVIKRDLDEVFVSAGRYTASRERC